MISEKIIGYLLLLFGIGIILGSTYSLYLVFTGKQESPQIFSFKMPTISLPSQQSYQLQLPEGMSLPEGVSLSPAGEKAATPSEIKLFPDEPINKMVNMSIYLLLMGFVASSGAKIASIGVKMIKDIKVVINQKDIKENLPTVS